MKCKIKIRKQWGRKARKWLITMVGILVSVLGVGRYVLAEEDAIKSKGNIRIEDEIFFYQEDFCYLEEEVHKLMEECR